MTPTTCHHGKWVPVGASLLPPIARVAKALNGQDEHSALFVSMLALKNDAEARS
jgi:hypothetical protein